MHSPQATDKDALLRRFFELHCKQTKSPDEVAAMDDALRALDMTAEEALREGEPLFDRRVEMPPSIPYCRDGDSI